MIAPALDLDLDTPDGTMAHLRVGRTTSATVDFDALTGDGTWTASRRHAVDHSSVGLLRPGDPLVEALRHQAGWDESSQVFAVFVPGRPGTVAVRADLIVAVDPTSAVEAWRSAE